MNLFSSVVLDSLTIHTTSDYSLFKMTNGNRDVLKPHIDELVESMRNNYIFTVILVNEKHEIIDGQHRFMAIKKLGLPLNYIICKGYGLPEVHILNLNTSRWKMDTHLESFVEKGLEDYIIYRKFKEKYNLSHIDTIALLKSIPGKPDIKKFNNGEFKVRDLLEAEYNIERIMMLEPYYKGVRRRAFIFAMISLFKNPNFDFFEFLKKVKIQPTALKDCTKVDYYKELIEDIYNYRRQDKVNLRF
jgi:hypothetical protein